MSLAKNATLRQLKTFATVARLGSVSLASYELHVTQSAASLQLAALERAIGVKLLARTGRGVRLTEAGTLLNGYAEGVLGLWNEASEELQSFQGAFSGTLSVGAVTTAEYWVPHLLVGFVNDSPRVKVKLFVANREEIVRALSTHRIDLAIMGTPPEELKVTASAFAKNPMAFVASPNHPLMRTKSLEMRALAESHLLVREQGSGSRNAVERMFREAGLQLRVGSEISSNEALKQMCAAGFGPAFLSIHTCVLEMRAGALEVMPLPNNPMEREWYFVRLASRKVPSIVLAFEAFLRTSGQQRIASFVNFEDRIPRTPSIARAPRARKSSSAADA